MMEILPSFQVDIKVEEKQDPREGKKEERKKDGAGRVKKREAAGGFRSLGWVGGCLLDRKEGFSLGDRVHYRLQRRYITQGLMGARARTFTGFLRSWEATTVNTHLIVSPSWTTKKMQYQQCRSHDWAPTGLRPHTQHLLCVLYVFF